MNAQPLNARVIVHESATEFSNECVAWLSEKEIVNHGVISLAHALMRDHPLYSPPFHFTHVLRGRKIAGCSIYAEPDGLVLSDFAPDAAPILFAYLENLISLPSRIFGPEEPVRQFADLFGAARKRNYRIDSTWRTHVLENALPTNPTVSGYKRVGGEQDLELVRVWGNQYDREKPANLNINRFLLNKLAEGNLHLWVDGEPRCVATISGQSCSGPRISAVFTPKSMRGCGYASALVDEIGKEYLKAGREYVTLSTLVGDPAERIYKKLGYTTDGEKICVIFE